MTEVTDRLWTSSDAGMTAASKPPPIAVVCRVPCNYESIALGQVQLMVPLIQSNQHNTFIQQILQDIKEQIEPTNHRLRRIGVDHNSWPHDSVSI